LLAPDGRAGEGSNQSSRNPIKALHPKISPIPQSGSTLNGIFQDMETIAFA
jgi:hypothetical protein